MESGLSRRLHLSLGTSGRRGKPLFSGPAKYILQALAAQVLRRIHQQKLFVSGRQIAIASRPELEDAGLMEK